MSALFAPGLPRTVLRLHRTALIVWAAFVLGAIGCLVWLNEVTAPDARVAAATCRPEDTPTSCHGFFANLDYSEPMGWVSTVVYYSFWAVAAWAGAALIGRELRTAPPASSGPRASAPPAGSPPSRPRRRCPWSAARSCWARSSPGCGPPTGTSWSATGPGTAS